MQVVEALYGGDPVGEGNDVLATYFQKPQRSISIPSSPIGINLSAFMFPGQLLVCFSGIVNANQGLRVFGGYGTPRALLPDLTANSEMANLAREVVDGVKAARKTTVLDVVFCGHSAGGGVAHVAAALLAATSPSVAITVVTCGSPRAYWSNPYANYPNVSTSRYMRPGDAVCRLVPKPDEFPGLFRPFELSLLLQWSPYMHLTGGKLLRGNGILEDADLPPAHLQIPPTSLALWFAGIDVGLTREHSLAAYIRDLLAFPEQGASGRRTSNLSFPGERPWSRQQVTANVELARQQAGLDP